MLRPVGEGRPSFTNSGISFSSAPDHVLSCGNSTASPTSRLIQRFVTFTFTAHFALPAIAAASVPKGSIAINGVSLTVSGLGDDFLSVDAIPTTLRETNLGTLREGAAVNLESDVLGRYALRGNGEAGNAEARRDSSAGGGLSLEDLASAGFL